jgi:hypothetical protein
MIKDVHINNTRKLVEESGNLRRGHPLDLRRAGAPLAATSEGGRARRSRCGARGGGATYAPGALQRPGATARRYGHGPILGNPYPIKGD